MQTEVTRSLPVPLTDAEVADRVREARLTGESIGEMTGKIAALAEQSKRLKEEVAVAQRREAHLVKVADDREEHRDVECRWLYDLASGTATLSRVDTGETVEQRALTTEERKELEQRPLQFGDVPQQPARRSRRQTTDTEPS